VPFSYPEIRTLHGLYLQRNTFTVPDGACEMAENVVVKNDNMISSRRGYYTYFDPNTGTLNNLFNYQDTLLAIYADKIRYYSDTGTAPNETGSEHTITGETITISSDRTSRSLQANSNLYFTTDNGMIKLPAYNGTLAKTGAPPGLDISLSYATSAASWFPSGDTVGYRVVFGYTDVNDNLILGAPSQIAQINNPAATGVTYSSSGGGPWTVTVTNTSHGLIPGQYVVVSGASDSDANGTFAVATVPTVSTFTYSVSSADPTSGTLNYAMASSVLLEFTVPSDVSTSLPWFYRVYRSSVQTIATGLYSDFKLINESILTSAQISSKIVFFSDDVDDILRGTELYTNENSGEGELQANTRPPLCDDVTYFKNYAMYANCNTRQILQESVVDPTSMSATDYVEVKIDSTTRRYVAATGVANQTVPAAITNSAGNIQINYVAHGLANGSTVYVSNITGGTLTAGTYYVVSTAADSFRISLTAGGAAIAYNSEASCYFEGVTNGTYPIFFLSASSSAATRLAQTAQGLVKSINRDSSSLVYADYASLSNQVPGKFRLSAKAFTGIIYMRANSVTAGTAFSPALPDSFITGDQVYSKNDAQPNAVYISKLGEPEAVPLINFLPAGSKNYEILRIKALRDSVIIVKTDGVYRLVGDSLSNFTISLLDGTISCVANSSLDVLNNQVVFLSNQGVCMVSESSVQIISREKLEDLIQPILGKTDLGTYTAGMGYETERMYLITTTTPNNDEPDVTYSYNILTNEWTSWDRLIVQGFVGPRDVMYYISLDNTIIKERKNQTKVDYSDQNYDVTIDAISGSENAAATITTSGGNPKEGDMIVKDDVITWIVSDPVLISGNTYTVVLDFANNLLVADSEILYESFYRTLKWSPFHAGEVSRMKLFSQFIINLRDNSLTKATLSFGGNVYGSSGDVDWISPLIFQGWGLFPWGFESWGQANSIELTSGTQPAPILRTYIPPYEARATFIQPTLVARKAGEPLNIQSIAYVLRPYNERVSR
jgi:hypothetical protein